MAMTIGSTPLTSELQIFLYEYRRLVGFVVIVRMHATRQPGVNGAEAIDSILAEAALDAVAVHEQV